MNVEVEQTVGNDTIDKGTGGDGDFDWLIVWGNEYEKKEVFFITR